jgi:serine-type D-Ala-D-Ala carboxypeptidase
MNAFSKYLIPQLQRDAGLLLDRVFEEALAKGIFSGAELLVAVHDTPVVSKSWGRTRTGGDIVTPSTRFDLASLTKPLVTAPLVLTAIAREIMSLDDPLERFFPAGRIPPEKREITIRHLLTHSSGLPAYKPFYLKLIGLPFEVRQNKLASMILDTPLDSAPGTAAVYSDLGFMLLGIILEQLFETGLDRIAEDALFGPLAIDELHFCPLKTGSDPEELSSDTGSKARSLTFVATEFCPWRKRELIGEVDDENAWCLNGIGGHAGLFGTASGVFALLSFLRSAYDGKISSHLWPRALVRLFWSRAGIPENSPWCLGYDTPSPVNSSAGRNFSRNTIGHLGFTGTSFWFDLDQQILFILLTNRVYPSRQNDAIRQFRPLVHDIVMKALKNEI